MKTHNSALIKILVLSYLSVLCVSQGFDFFYFVQQIHYVAQQEVVAIRQKGKPPADFGIHGLWPTFNNASCPSNCNDNNPYDQSQVSNLVSLLENEWPTLACPRNNGTKLWAHGWNKHGTCSESVLDQQGYFQANLDLKKKANLLQALKKAGIQPNGKFYSVGKIKEEL